MKSDELCDLGKFLTILRYFASALSDFVMTPGEYLIECKMGRSSVTILLPRLNNNWCVMATLASSASVPSLLGVPRE
jgi:hypothetical protein